MSGDTAKQRPTEFCGKYKRFQRVGLRMCVDARTDGNLLFIFDRSLRENKKRFSHLKPYTLITRTVMRPDDDDRDDGAAVEPEVA
jgi:hypothetical protein